jgi:hypothetical protein
MSRNVLFGNRFEVESVRLRAALTGIRERQWAASSNERRVPFQDIAGDSLDSGRRLRCPRSRSDSHSPTARSETQRAHLHDSGRVYAAGLLVPQCRAADRERADVAIEE